MRRLRQRFSEDLVVLGVHSAKFPAEKETENIRRATQRHGIDHPVVNDAGFEIWQSYAVKAWPTVVLIDPEGRIVGLQAGEIDAEEVGRRIEALLDHRPGPPRREGESEEASAAAPSLGSLRFPAKLTASEDGRLYVADTGHHRILEIEILACEGTARGALRRVFGGVAGLVDGGATEARFRGPRGLALAGGSLYVADTDNHALRRIELATGEVSTVAGTGRKARRLGPGGEEPTRVELRSPWDLVKVDDILFVAMAGSHQIWALVDGGGIAPLAGSGQECLVDGPRQEAGFNQPSGLTLAGGDLFVADAEASAIRRLRLAENARVETLAGQGLFVFGDRDGDRESARLQHPTGLAHDAGRLYVADSYNHKIKMLDLSSGRVETWLGSGAAGLADGVVGEARLYEPQGLSVAAGRLWIADTNNHRVRWADLEGGRLHTLSWEESNRSADTM